MELSLFSRDVIALSTAVALSHDMFDAAVYLGVCDKIVPGLLIGALSFGHLPAVFLPAGPMPSGLPNDEKSKIRQLYAEGKADARGAARGRGEGLPRARHLHLLRHRQHQPDADGDHGPAPAGRLVRQPEHAAARRADHARRSGGRWRSTALGNAFTPIGHVIDERAVVNGVVGLHATGGSTNHTIHLIAMAAAAGIALTWEDFADLAEVTPLLARVYPNGKADVNHFHAAGGMGLLIRELADAGLLHADARTVWGERLADYAVEPHLDDGGRGSLAAGAPTTSGDASVLRGAADPFQPTGGLRVLEGPLGRAVIKTSAVAPERHVIEAPARVFHSQEELQAAFRAGELDRDFVAVVRFQGPKAIGMPELHKLMPPLGVLQDRGHKVALVTDGRLSGASGKVPSAIHVTPRPRRAARSARSATATWCGSTRREGRLDVLVDAEVWARRGHAEADLPAPMSAWGASCSPPSAARSARRTRARRFSLRPDVAARRRTLRLRSPMAGDKKPVPFEATARSRARRRRARTTVLRACARSSSDRRPALRGDCDAVPILAVSRLRRGFRRDDGARANGAETARRRARPGDGREAAGGRVDAHRRQPDDRGRDHAEDRRGDGRHRQGYGQTNLIALDAAGRGPARGAVARPARQDRGGLAERDLARILCLQSRLHADGAAWRRPEELQRSRRRDFQPQRLRDGRARGGGK